VTVSAPARAFGAFKPTASPGLLAASSAIAATFTATPFVIAASVDRFDIGIGWAAVLSTAQVGGFTVANLVGNRRFRASARLARQSLAVFVAANALSIVLPLFPALVIARTIAGGSMGLLTWIAWADSATDGKRRGEIAAIGPLAGAVSAPVLGILSALGGLPGLFAVLTFTAAIGLFLPISVAEHEISRVRNPIQTPGVRLVLVSMGIVTGAGSMVFVFAGVIAENLEMSEVTTSLALAVNALAGIPAARFAGRRRVPGLWIAIIGGCALLLTRTDSVVIYFTILALWGLSFWSAIPEVFSMLSDRSKFPSDRVGDAQAAMAMGRVAGPTVGGMLVAGGSFTVVGVVALVLMLAAAACIEIVATAHRWR
jgi:predicted MFS family arabinose efflux permease